MPEHIGMDGAISRAFSTAEDALRLIAKNEPYVAKLVGGDLTTNGAQYSAKTTVSTGATSKSTAHTTAFSSTISWPGLDGSYIDEIEFGLTANINSCASTIGYRWEMKNATGSTWQVLSTFRELKNTTYADETQSGIRLYRDGSLATGYNRLPINLRLRFYSETASKGWARVKSSSYIKIKPRRN